MRMPLSVAIGLSLLCHVVVLTQEGWQLPAPEVAAPVSPLSVTWVQQSVVVNTAPPPVHPAVTEASITLPPVEPPSPDPTDLIPERSEIPPAVAETPAETDDATAAQQPPTQTEVPLFPQHALLRYEVFYGSLLAGLAELNWQQQGADYQLQLRLQPVFSRPLLYQSEGQIDKNGLKPRRFSGERKGQVREQAEFDYTQQQLRYGAQLEHLSPLPEAAQDILSVAFHIALQGASVLQQQLAVTNGRKLYHYPLTVMGEATFTLESHSIPVIHLASQTDQESTEFWFAPQFANLPLRIRRHSPELTLDQRLIFLSINGETQLERPPKERPQAHG